MSKTIEEGIAGIGRYLVSTEHATYAILYTTDVQFDPDDPAQAEEFRAMEQTRTEIQVVVDGRWDKNGLQPNGQGRETFFRPPLSEEFAQKMDQSEYLHRKIH